MLRSRFFLTSHALSTALFGLSLSFDAFANNNQLFQDSSRNYISIVGSSTVYPFAASIAEKFGRQKINGQKFRTPTVEATGTGGGFKLFCGGTGFNSPDFSNASRKIEESEIKKCQENGVQKVGEIKIGYDGIVLANSTLGKKLNLTKKQIFLALAEKIPQQGKLIENPYKKWNEVDSRLPAMDIRIYGPPSTSGTRDAFVELVMEKACIDLPEFVAAYDNKKARQKKCHTIRSDGKFIEAGENDNLILQKLRNDKDAFGIFGFSFLSENKNSIQAATVDSVEPSFENIVNNKYSVSRPLFIYFKYENFNLVPGMKEFIRTVISKDTLGADGYLVQKGLIPLTNSELKKLRDELLPSL